MTHLPKDIFKFCSRCGSDKTSYAEKALRCDSCNFILYTNSAAAVAVIIENSKNEILLVTRAVDPQKGMLDLPGGFIDPDESAEEAVSREIKEELNIDINNFRYFTSRSNRYLFSGVTVFTTDLAFIVKVKDEVEMLAQDDITDFKYYPLEDIELDKIAFKSIKEIIKKYIDEQDNR